MYSMHSPNISYGMADRYKANQLCKLWRQVVGKHATWHNHHNDKHWY